MEGRTAWQCDALRQAKGNKPSGLLFKKTGTSHTVPVFLKGLSFGAVQMKSTGSALKGAVFGAADHLILRLPAHMGEIGVIAGDAHCEILVFFRLALRLAQGFGIHHGNLQLHAAVFKICPKQGREFLNSIRAFNDAGMNAQIQRAAGDMIEGDGGCLLYTSRCV